MSREDNKINDLESKDVLEFDSSLDSGNRLDSKIKIENISKSFDGDKIIDNISIDVREGELVSILGPSGCGKSTIFNMIAGLLKQDSGTVDVNGKLSYMYQKDLLLPYKTIIDLSLIHI